MLPGILGQQRRGAFTHAEYRRSRAELLEQGVLLPKGDAFVFTSNNQFGSPSAAATVICGHNINGRTAWRTEDGTPVSRLH